ncbi:hypothetical protein [Actinomadura kijaniata]|uniref:hypothetical protein n=1 Tax=Actinomadura kijaniata TaxID=46161 RepID=UPI000830893B|nr:hypothetical protein [Actinomadura kijaniata]
MGEDGGEERWLREALRRADSAIPLPDGLRERVTRPAPWPPARSAMAKPAVFWWVAWGGLALAGVAVGVAVRRHRTDVTQVTSRRVIRGAP